MSTNSATQRYATSDVIDSQNKHVTWTACEGAVPWVHADMGKEQAENVQG